MSMLETPQNFVGHKHDCLLQKMVSTPRCAAHAGRRITIRKVKAHAGVLGIELADATAKSTRGADVPQYRDMGTHTYGSHRT